MKRKRARKLSAKEEPDSEDWCFVCKEGGQLLLCDFQDCAKSYHPKCVGMKNSSLKTLKTWICSRHSCSGCDTLPKFYCLSCPIATCELCMSSMEFLPVKGEKGLCRDCLELALRIEDYPEPDLDMITVDLKYEDLFEQYFKVIMDKEGLTYDDFHQAKLRSEKVDGSSNSVEILDAVQDAEQVVAKGKQKQSRKLEVEVEISESGEGGDLIFVSVQDAEPVIAKGEHKRSKKSKVEVGTRESGQGGELGFDAVQDAESVVSVAENQQLRKSEVQVQTSEYVKGNALHFIDSKKQGGSTSGEEFLETQLDSQVPKSIFASTGINNIKLVYLKRTLVEKLLAETQDFEEKLVGCFVGVRKESEKGTRKRSYEVLPITGISISKEDSNRAILLQISCVPSDVPISLLSDDEITEEQCLDLQKKVKDGLIRKLTIEELEQKARSVHEDLTKHWVESELARLQKLIDFTNEKGRRATLEHYLDERSALMKPHFQQHLLSKLPRVTAEEI